MKKQNELTHRTPSTEALKRDISLMICKTSDERLLRRIWKILLRAIR